MEALWISIFTSSRFTAGWRPIGGKGYDSMTGDILRTVPLPEGRWIHELHLINDKLCVYQEERLLSYSVSQLHLNKTGHCLFLIFHCLLFSYINIIMQIIHIKVTT